MFCQQERFHNGVLNEHLHPFFPLTCKLCNNLPSLVFHPSCDKLFQQGSTETPPGKLVMFGPPLFAVWGQRVAVVFSFILFCPCPAAFVIMNKDSKLCYSRKHGKGHIPPSSNARDFHGRHSCPVWMQGENISLLPPACILSAIISTSLGSSLALPQRKI